MNDKDILDLYDNNWSTYAIAEKYNTYPNKIRRILIKYGRELRTNSEAQKSAIITGRHYHPTKGRQRTIEERQKISESVYKYWQNISDADREEYIEKKREQWNNMSEYQREEMRILAGDGMRRAAKEGSRIEKFLFKELTNRGYKAIFHKKGLIPNDDLEVDIFIPELKTAIEIDGPSHFFPIWGEQKLQKNIKTDAHKSGLLLGAGLFVIRIKYMSKSVTLKNKDYILNHIIACLEKIEKSKRSIKNRYIELEIE